jgi:hypothetical protein
MILAGSMTPLKFIWPSWNLKSSFWAHNFFKREYPATLFQGNFPIPYLNLIQKKLGNSRLNFRFHWGRGHWPHWNRFWRLSKRLSQRIRSHMRYGFSPWIRALGEVDWFKKPRFENLYNHVNPLCPINIV